MESSGCACIVEGFHSEGADRPRAGNPGKNDLGFGGNHRQEILRCLKKRNHQVLVTDWLRVDEMVKKTLTVCRWDDQ